MARERELRKRGGPNQSVCIGCPEPEPAGDRRYRCKGSAFEIIDRAEFRRTIPAGVVTCSDKVAIPCRSPHSVYRSLSPGSRLIFRR